MNFLHEKMEFYLIINILCLIIPILIIIIYIKFNPKNSRFNALMAKIPGPTVRYPLRGNLGLVWFQNSTNLLNRN